METRGLRLAALLFLTCSIFPGSLLGQQPAPAKPSTPPPASQVSPATAPPSTPSASPEKVILKVGDEQITQADLDFLIKGNNPQMSQAPNAQGRRSIGERYALMLLLTQEARKGHLDSSPDLRRRMAFGQVQLLAQAEYEAITRQATTTPDEVSQYFSAHPEEFEETQVRQVAVRKKPEGAKEGTPGLSAQEARARAESLRSALAGGTDPKEVAKGTNPAEVSMDKEPRTVRRGQLPAVLDKAVFQLKEGEVSEILETPQNVIFLQIVGHHRPELKDATARIENSLRQKKIQAQLDELKKKAAIWMDDQYFGPPSAPTPSPAAQPAAGVTPPKPPK